MNSEQTTRDKLAESLRESAKLAAQLSDSGQSDCSILLYSIANLAQFGGTYNPQVEGALRTFLNRIIKVNK